jgi:hypothetical protein
MITRLRPAKHAPRTAIPVAVAALFIVVALAAAACGGGGDSEGVASIDGSSQNDTDAAAETTSQNPEDARLEFARCMREHGVNVPDPGSHGGLGLSVPPGTSRAEFDEAQRACQPILERAAPELSEEQRSVMQDAALEFARCMREHGIDVPDPQTSDGGIIIRRGPRSGGEFELDDPEFKAAQEACQHIMEEAARDAGLPLGGRRTERSGGEEDS